jgi:hypothetical protein
MMKEDETKNPSVGTLFDEAIKRLKVWKDDVDGTLRLEQNIRAGHFGLAIKHLNLLLSKDVTESKNAIRPLTQSQLIQKRMQIFEKLGYNMLRDYDKNNQVVSCPKAYAPF